MTELDKTPKGLFPKKETLTVEFRSDPKSGLKDQVVVDAAVGFANAEGGTLFIGLNNDGSVSGVRTLRWRDPELAAARIASRTVPPITAAAEIVRVSDALEVLAIHVQKSTGIVTTNEGKLLKRCIKIDGTVSWNPPILPGWFLCSAL